MPKEVEQKQLTPDQLAAIPPSFFDYSQANPGILPDYTPFARQAFEIIRDNPQELVVFTGRRGIGKTTHFIPALLAEAERSGVQPLGSIFSIPEYGKEATYLDPHEYHIRDRGFGEIDPRFQRPYWYGERGPSDLTETIRGRFESAGGEALFVMDEAVGAMSGLAEVIKTVLREAQANDVDLTVTQPVAPDQDAGEKQAEEQERERLAILSRRVLKEVAIEVALVPEIEVAKMLGILGVDPALQGKLTASPLTRSLRVVEHIFHELGNRRTRYGDSEIYGTKELRKVFDTSIGGLNYVLGLSHQEYGDIRQQFSEPEE